MGDTDILGDMELIGELHQPKIGTVPIGDRLYNRRRSWLHLPATAIDGDTPRLWKACPKGISNLVGCIRS